MNIDVWSDISCPFCYMGKKQLEKAIELSGHGNEITVTFHSFELAPDSPIENPQTLYEMLEEKYGRSQEQSRALNERMFGNAHELGITFRFDDVVQTNTFDAHRLIHYARTHNKESEMFERLHKAYFTDGLHIGHHDVLLTCAREVGLDTDQVGAMLESDEYHDAVHADEERARELGITGVPFFVFNNQYGVSGAQGIEALVTAISQAHAG